MLRTNAWLSMTRRSFIALLSFLVLPTLLRRALGLAPGQITNSLGMKFNPIPGTNVLVGIWDVRVQDYAVFANETNHQWPKPDFKQTGEDPAVNVSWNDAVAFCDSREIRRRPF
jgi:hypothetical protein